MLIPSSGFLEMLPCLISYNGAQCSESYKILNNQHDAQGARHLLTCKGRKKYRTCKAQAVNWRQRNVRPTGELHTEHERLTITQTPLRQKRTEVTQVRRHDAPCGFPFFIPNIVASVRASQVGVQKALTAHHLLVLENATTTFNPTTN
jgi:hypothetical protein